MWQSGGYRQQVIGHVQYPNPQAVSDKSKGVAALLCFFLEGLGVH